MKVFHVTSDGKYCIESLSDETIEQAIHIYRNNFLMEDVMGKAAGLSNSSETLEIMTLVGIDVAKDGVSLVAVTNDDKREVAAIAFNNLQLPSEEGEEPLFEKFQRECKVDALKGLFAFWSFLNSKMDPFEFCKVDCIFEIMFLATSKNHRGHGLATALSKYSYQLAQDLKNQPKPIVKFRPKDPKYADVEPLITTTITRSPQLFTAYFTSKTSQKIGDKLGFEKLIDIPYDDFVFDGESFGNRLTDKKAFIRISAKRI